VKMRDKCVWPDGLFLFRCESGHELWLSEMNPGSCVLCSASMDARIIPFRPLGNVK
jgi:hypothetical protein